MYSGIVHSSCLPPLPPFWLVPCFGKLKRFCVSIRIAKQSFVGLNCWLIARLGGNKSCWPELVRGRRVSDNRRGQSTKLRALSTYSGIPRAEVSREQQSCTRGMAKRRSQGRGWSGQDVLSVTMIRSLFTDGRNRRSQGRGWSGQDVLSVTMSRSLFKDGRKSPTCHHLSRLVGGHV